MVVKRSNSFVIFSKYWLPVLIYAIIIFSISAIPGKKILPLFKGQDILFHIFEYTVFALLIKRALKGSNTGISGAKTLFWVFFLALAYASSDELHQAFIPGRCPSISDMVYDGIGVLIANIFYR